MLIGNPWVYLNFSNLQLQLLDDEDDYNGESTISSIASSEHHNTIAITTQNGLITTYFNIQNPQQRQSSSLNINDLVVDNDNSNYFSQLSWQGESDKYLVAGTTDGIVMYLDVSQMQLNGTGDCNVESLVLGANAEIHSSMITRFIWNNGKDDESLHLLSVDRDGCCCLWKNDCNEMLLPIMKFHNDYEINAIVFLDDMFPQDEKNNNFMFALDNGLLYHANELGNCNEIKIHDNPDSIISIHCNQKEGTIIAISNSSQLMKFHIRDGIVSMKSNALKLSIELNTESDTLLSPFGHLICKTNKGSIHCFDLKNDENYELKIPISNSIDKIDDIFTHFVMCGNILTLYSREKMCVLLSFDSERNRWEPAGTSSFDSFINAPTEFCVFAKNALLIGTVNNVAIATEEVYNSTVADDILVLQTEISTFAIFHEVNNGPFAIVDTHNCICGIVMDREYICAWSVLDLYIYKIDYNNCNLYSEISMKVQSVTINSGSLYIAKGGSLVVTDLFGIQRLTIRLPQEEGQIIDLYSSFDNLIILTCSGTIKIMDISKKEPKLLRSSTLTRADTVHFQANNISVKGNADGTVISFLHKYSYQLYFYNTVNGLVKRFECDVKGVLSQHWDPVFPRLLVCETRDKNGSFNCLTLFISEKLQTFVHERDVAEKCCVLMGGNIPFKFFISRNELGKQRFHKKCIDGFEAVDAKNAGTISAMVDFTYYLIIQNLDKAHLCIINVENKEAWVKLAYASVQHERLDIAQRCLMKMDNGLGVAAVRTADKEAALAEVAIQLGWTAEAERLYKKSNRLDLLCDLYRRQHERGKAMDTCQNDTVQEESLNLYTKFYERSSSVHQKNLQGCISEKEMAKQLILNNGPIEPFLKQQNDVGLSRWYASYLESIGDLKGAKNIYNVTNDILSLVRIACSEDDLNTAFNLVRNTSSCSGAYHLARHLEAKGDIENALLCFGRSGKFNYAIRLAKSHGLDDAIFDLALQSEVPKIVECAHYFERCDQRGRAVELYIKGGEKKKALDLILKLPLDTFGQFQADALSVIHELGNEIPEDIAHKCFSILLKSGLHGQAFKLFLQYEHDPEEIFQLYLEYGIELTDTILDEITSQCKIFYNKSLLKTIAFIFKAQGKFTLACKKFTQGGDRSNAIKCLLQTGDTRHIISYAFTSRTKDVYIIAANYLQTLDYYNDEDLKKSLLQLYMKAKSNEHLFRLMSSWSSFEASEGEYEITVKWLHEAKKYGGMIKSVKDSENIEWIDRNVISIQLFLEAQTLVSSNQTQTDKICRDLIVKHQKGDLLQLGDCFAVLVQIERDSDEALRLVKEMYTRGLSPEEYLEQDIIENIYIAAGRQWKRNDSDNEGSENREDVVED